MSGSRILLRRFGVVLIASVLLASTTACVAEPPPVHTPRPAASAAPSATPTPDTSTAKIQIDGLGLTFLTKDGTILDRILYSADPEKSVAAIATHLGESPVTEFLPEALYSEATTSSAWGKGLTIRYETDRKPEGSLYFWVSSHASTVGKGISVQTTRGFSVGDLTTALAAGTPGSVVQNWDGGTAVWFDLDAKENGVLAESEPASGPIESISAPVNIHQDI
jgi:hypothetical protein